MLGIGVFGSFLMFLVEKLLPSKYLNYDETLMMKKWRALAHEKIQEIEELLENDHENPIVQNKDVERLKNKLTNFMEGQQLVIKSGNRPKTQSQNYIL